MDAAICHSFVEGLVDFLHRERDLSHRGGSRYSWRREAVVDVSDEERPVPGTEHSIITRMAICPFSEYVYNEYCLHI